MTGTASQQIEHVGMVDLAQPMKAFSTVNREFAECIGQMALALRGFYP